jgi:hypothetical protein
MPPVSQSCFREDDLSHVANAVSRSAEEILARARLSVDCAWRFPWGILIQQSDATHRWQPNADSVECLHLLDEIALVPELGVFALVNRAIANFPAAQYIAVCAWFKRPAAAQYLWTERLGLCEYDRHVIEAYLALGLEERPGNDPRPGYSQIRHGTLLRFDAAGAQRARRHFLLDAVTTPIEPTVVALGGNAQLVFARSRDQAEPLRAVLVSNSWSAHMAEKELRRWLKQKPPPYTQKEIFPGR